MGVTRDGNPARSLGFVRGSATALPIYLAAGSIFAALAARSFALPLRVDELGGDKITVGLLFTVTTITSAGLSLPAGFLVDRFGKRTLLLLAVVIGGVSQLGLGLAGSIPPMFLWQALAGVGGAAAQAALMSALVDLVPAPRLGRSMGWLTLAFQVGFLVGPAAAGLALQSLSLQATLSWSALLFALALVMALVGIPSIPGTHTGWNVIGPLRTIARGRAFLFGCVGMLGATLVWGTVQAYLPLFGKEQLHLPESQIGYLIAIQAVANGLARIPGGRFVDRMPNHAATVVLGLAGYAIGLSLLPHLTTFWSATLLLSASVPLLATAYLALGLVFGNLSTPETRGVAMGVYGTMLYLGLGAGPALFGIVVQQGGYGPGFTACAATGLAFAALTALLARRPSLFRGTRRERGRVA